LENRFNRHYKVGMEANGSRIVAIRYPENTKPKWFGHVSRNSKHMLIDLEDGRTIRDEQLVLISKSEYEAAFGVVE
jgi:hypothetical protein